MAILKGEIWTKFIVISFPSGQRRKRALGGQQRKEHTCLASPSSQQRIRAFLFFSSSVTKKKTAVSGARSGSHGGSTSLRSWRDSCARKTFLRRSEGGTSN